MAWGIPFMRREIFFVAETAEACAILGVVILEENIMWEAFLRKFDPLFQWGFRIHDGLCDFLAKHAGKIKTGLLTVAHLSLFGFLFPEMRKGFGETARNLLLVILFLSPLSKIFRMRLLLLLMGFRRQLGIWFAYLSTVHGIGYMIDPDWAEFIFRSGFPAPFGMEPRFLFGIAAFTLTLPLLFTSNNLAMRLLKGNWKRVQMLAYPVFVLVILHNFILSTLSAEGVAGILASVLVIGAYVLLKLLAWKNFLPPLVRTIQYVSVRYGEYQTVRRTQGQTEAPSLS
jgi:sulfoxide reductase heme-binding subunit YedZ